MSTEEIEPPWAAGTAQRMHELDPELNDSELAILEEYGGIQRFAQGTQLWRAGDKHPMLVVLDGSLEVYRGDGASSEDIIITHGPRHYIVSPDEPLYFQRTD